MAHPIAATLERAGFSKEQAARIARNKRFVRGKENKTPGKFRNRVYRLARAYRIEPSEVRQAIAEYPSFFSRSPHKVVRSAARAYGVRSAQIVKAIRTSPTFAGRNHERVIREALLVYGPEREAAVKHAFLSMPEITALDHARIVRHGVRLGKLVGMSDTEVKDWLLKKPVLASYAPRRYIAALDVGRQLNAEGIPNDSKMLDTWLRTYLGASPYVPGLNRVRVTKAKRAGILAGTGSTPLANALRKSHK